MKPAESAQVDFIKECLRAGEARKIILQKFTTNYKTCIKTFDNRLKLAQKALASEQTHIQKQAEESIKQDIEGLKTKIMTSVERQKFLSDIISAQTDIKTIGKSAVALFVFPDGRKEIISLADKLKALAELNKMCGDYAPEKLQHSGDLKILGGIFKIGGQEIPFE